MSLASIRRLLKTHLYYILVFFTLLNFLLVLFAANVFYELEAPNVHKIPSKYERVVHDRMTPLIFVGGHPRSGTTLMRALLDAHPDIRCGQETRVIRRLLKARDSWLYTDEAEKIHLDEAGVTKDVLDNAMANFLLEIIVRHGEPAPRLCNKDATTIKMGSYILELFPNAKFIFIVRDGRAMVHSIISRKIPLAKFDLTSYRQCLTRWNDNVSKMYEQCMLIGKRCFIVLYEQLILHPREWMHQILDFLDVPWSESVLHHEQYINQPGGVLLSKTEQSSDQIIKPLYSNSLTKWMGHIPDDVARDMADIAPMLSIFGYNTHVNSPTPWFYGIPDKVVSDNTKQILENSDAWEAKIRELSLHNVSYFVAMNKKSNVGSKCLSDTFR